MALKPCKECGNQISTAAAACPQCGAPTSAKPKSNKLANGVLGGVGLLVLIGMFGWKGEDTKAPSTSWPSYSSNSSAPPPSRIAAIPATLPSTPAIALPASQQGFVDIVEASRRAYNAAANDMARGSTRPTRARGLCDSMAGTAVNNWIGTITTLSTNSDGDGVLGISVAKDVIFKTWNNSFSDISDNTILNHNSSIYRKASSLSVGQKVRFSGNLIRGQNDCFKESSLSMSGSMKDPEFIFRFGSIDPI